MVRIRAGTRVRGRIRARVRFRVRFRVRGRLSWIMSRCRPSASSLSSEFAARPAGIPACRMHVVAGWMRIWLQARCIWLQARCIWLQARCIWLQARDARLTYAVLPDVLLIRSRQARRDRGLVPG